MRARKYQIPDFLVGRVDQAKYERWLHRKAVAHIKRDRKRDHRRAGGVAITNESYKLQIHEAVCSSGGLDWYTGEALEWEKISSYDNAESKLRGSAYKKEQALLPSVDHVERVNGGWDFVISSWRMNDAKNDLSLVEFLAICRLVIDRHGGEANSAVGRLEGQVE